jgi:hypothetical protein
VTLRSTKESLTEANERNRDITRDNAVLTEASLMLAMDGAYRRRSRADETDGKRPHWAKLDSEAGRVSYDGFVRLSRKVFANDQKFLLRTLPPCVFPSIMSQRN